MLISVLKISLTNVTDLKKKKWLLSQFNLL